MFEFPFIQSTRRLSISWMPYLTKRRAQKSIEVVSCCPLPLVCCQSCWSISSSALVSHTLGPITSKHDALWNCLTIQTKVATLALSAFMGEKTFEQGFINHNAENLAKKYSNTLYKFHGEPSRPWVFPLASTITTTMSSSSMIGVFRSRWTLLSIYAEHDEEYQQRKYDNSAPTPAPHRVLSRENYTPKPTPLLMTPLRHPH